MTIESEVLKNSYTGNGSATSFSYEFRILTEEEISVLVDGAEQELTGDYTVTGVGDLNGGSVVFNTAPANGVSIVLLPDPNFTQGIDYDELDAFPAESHEEGLDRAALRDLTLREVQNRTLKYSPSVNISDPELPTPVNDTLLAFDGTTGKMKLSVTGTEIQNAASEALAAANSAAAALVSENAASNSATAASSSATAAANSATEVEDLLQSVPFRDTAYKVFADSPVAIVQDDNGFLVVFDTSGGDCVVNLPSIASLNLPFNIGFKKSTADVNTVTVNANGSDTIAGDASRVISSVGGFVLQPSATPSPDRWNVVEFGASAGNMTVDTFEAGTDFTGGSTGSLTSSKAIGSVNNLIATFDGLTQQEGITVDGTTVTFDPVIPVGIQKIQLRYGTTLSIGTPSDGSVTEAKLGSNSVSASKIQTDAVTTAKVEDGAITRDKLGFQPLAYQDVETLTASVDATLDFTDISLDFNEVQFIFNNLLPASDGVDLEMLVSTDSGASPTFQTTGYRWRVAQDASGSNHGAGTEITLMGASSQGSEISEGLFGELTLKLGSSTVRARHEGDFEYENVAGTSVVNRVSGTSVVDGKVRAVRFKYDSGNISSGSITMVGR